MTNHIPPKVLYNLVPFQYISLTYRSKDVTNRTTSGLPHESLQNCSALSHPQQNQSAPEDSRRNLDHSFIISETKAPSPALRNVQQMIVYWGDCMTNTNRLAKGELPILEMVGIQVTSFEAFHNLKSAIQFRSREFPDNCWQAEGSFRHIFGAEVHLTTPSCCFTMDCDFVPQLGTQSKV